MELMAKTLSDLTDDELSANHNGVEVVTVTCSAVGGPGGRAVIPIHCSGSWDVSLVTIDHVRQCRGRQSQSHGSRT